MTINKEITRDLDENNGTPSAEWHKRQGSHSWREEAAKNTVTGGLLRLADNREGNPDKLDISEFKG